MREDFIDFPVSDTWRDYYYDIGLTPYPSPRYWSDKNEEAERLKELTKEVARLRMVLDKIFKRILQSKTTPLPRVPQRRAKPWPVDTELNRLPENT